MYVKTTCCESVNNAQGETLHQNVTLKSDRFMYCNALNASTCFNEVCLDHELSWPILAYLKNRCTKHRLVCTHFDAFSKLITNMGIILNNSDFFFFEHFLKLLQTVGVKSYLTHQVNKVIPGSFHLMLLVATLDSKVAIHNRS